MQATSIKNIVAQLQSYDCNAIGLCGADGDAILAHKRESNPHPLKGAMRFLITDMSAILIV